MEFAVISAVDEEWGIGKEGRLPWHEPADFEYFRNTTMGSTCFMGRHTYAEIALLRQGKKHLLPGRKCVVVTSGTIDDPRVTVCNDLTQYKDYAGESNFFIGGNSLFAFGLTVATTVHITKIPGVHKCDIFFPYELLRGLEINNTIALTDTVSVTEYKKRT